MKTKYKVLVIEGPFGAGQWNGYVGLPKSHPWAKLSDIPATVHGGITYQSNAAPHCEPDGLYWVGFDTLHFGDWSPLDVKYGITERGIGRRWTIEEVRAEAESLASQAYEYDRLSNKLKRYFARVFTAVFLKEEAE